MNRIAEFKKVSLDRFLDDWNNVYCPINTYAQRQNAADGYAVTSLPRRATSGSAGYDFFAPCNLFIEAKTSVTVPTGIRCRIAEGWVLKIYPRSGLGFKYGLRLANTVGIIDSDYYISENEGHILAKLTTDEKPVYIPQGTAMCQGVFVPYGITIDDDADGVRNGGFGSTDGINESTEIIDNIFDRLSK